jgi:multiple sugar transport system substrate-binding protein
VAEGDAPPPFAPDLSLDAIAAFSSGETALHASGSWDLPVTRRAKQVDAEVEHVEILPLPQRDPGNPATVLGGSSLYVPAGAEQRELAFAFMLALTADEVALELAAEEGRLPARSAVYDAPLFTSSPDLVAFVAELPHAEVMPLIAYPEVAAVFRDGLERALSQRGTPQQAMEDVQAFAEQWAAER